MDGRMMVRMEAGIDWQAAWAMAQSGEDEPPAAGPGTPQGSAGREKCTATAKQTGKRCGRWPVPGAAVCVMHGGKAPQVRDKAVQRLQEQAALALARKAAGDVDVAQFGDPYSALETAIAYGHHLALRLAALVEAIPDGELRYRGKVSEQLRGEVTAAQTALRDLRQSAAEAGRLGLAERRAGIRQQTADVLERALNLAIESAGLDIDGQARAREVFRRNLPVVRGEVEQDG